MRHVEVRYALRDGDALAFETFGDGPYDLIVRPGRWPIDLMWDLPQLASFMDALGRFARVITYDPRGQGASDPISDPGAAQVELACDDLVAVLDAASSDRATIMDMTQGSAAFVIAAMYPQRVRSLIVTNPRLSFPEYRGLSFEQRKKLGRALTATDSLRLLNPRVAHDAVLQDWWGRSHRLVTNPDGAARQMEWAAHTDVESALAAVHVPTLVFGRRDNRVWDIGTTREVASRIPGARLVELDGSEAELFLGDTTPVLSEIERFLRRGEPGAIGDRPLATVLYTDMVASTEQLVARGDKQWRQVLDDHDASAAMIVAEYRGRLVKQLGDGILATFDGPARAVHCAKAIRETIAERGITVRAGLHTGEIELRNDDVTGIAVHIASRVAALAAPGEILVSRTVVDLTWGSGINFDPRGDYKLKGVPGEWALFAAH